MSTAVVGTMAKWVVLLFVALLCASVRTLPPQRLIEDPPVILLHPAPPFLATGSRLSLACAAYGSPIPNITWSSPTQGISDYSLLSAAEETVNITETVIEDVSGIRYVVSILELCNSGPSHLTTHTYTCTATNGVTGVGLGNSSATFNIEPTVLEPAILLSHPNGSFEYGGRRTSLTCAAFGSPAPVITWGYPTLGIQPLADANDSINIYTEQITNTHGDALVLSTLELCNNDPSNKNIEISCTTSNGITTDLVGNQSASFSLDPYVEILTFSYEQMPATAQLLITFSGVVDTSVFKCNLSALTFLNTSRPEDPYSAFFSPRYPGRCGQVTNSTIVAYLDSRDYITILALGIFSSGANSYLIWKTTLLGPLLMVTETEIAYQVHTFVAQTHQVILLEFDLDFDAGQLLIHFGSIIDVASINVSGVAMSNGNATQGFSLTGGDIVSDSYATTVCIDMTNEDLLSIHNREICTSLENCFATFTSGFATDAFGNIGGVRTLKVSILRQEFVVPNPAVYLSVTTEYIGCAANVSLIPDEVYIVRETERIVRIDCHTAGPDINPVLSWQRGGLLLNGTVVPPFMNNWPYLSYAYFPEGMPVTYYGLFICTSQRGERIEHYIHDINPFVGTPDHLISVTLYDPIYIPVSIASIPQQSLEDIKVSFEPVNHSQPILPEIQVAEFKASVSFDHALYSLEGPYNIVFNLTALDSVTYTTVTIDVIDPVVTIFPPVAVIERLGWVTITCRSSSPELPVHWTIGNREIQDGGPFTLTPPGLRHSLQVLLDTSDQGILQGPISCFVEDPELNTTVASAVAPLHIVPDELTVWRNGLEQLLDNSFLSLDDEDSGSINLRCLGTQGNYDLIWKTVGISDLPQVVSSPTRDVNVSYVTNDANITLYNFRRFEGTLRCVSQQSGLATSIHLTAEESPRVCEIETDQLWNITWGITFAGTFDNQPCPEVRGTPVTGLAYRYCSEGATWETVVNVSNCRSMAFETLQTEAEMLFRAGSSLDDEVRDVQVSNLGEALANATDPTPVTSLFPQDLDTANNILDGIIGLLRENIAARRPASLHTEFIDTFNNMLSATNEEGWKQLQEMKVGSQKLLYNAEQYGIYLTEALNTTSIDTDEYGTNIPLLRTNIMVEAQKLSQNQSQVMDVIYPASDHPLSDKAQIVLPASLLIAKRAEAVVNILFVNLDDFLPEVDASIGTMTATMVLSSQVVTEEISNIPGSGSQNAELHFATHMIENSANPRCVFWNFSDPIGEGMWSTEGVETNTVEKNEDSFNLACTSEHFTSFAAIVDTSEVFMFTVPMYVGLGVLLLCSAVVAMALLIVFLVSCVKEIYTGLHYFVHLSFASATICACVVILGGLTTALANQGACTAVAALLQFFFTAAFSWLLCGAIVLTIMLSVRDYDFLSKCWWLAIFLLGWGLPAITTAISTGILHRQFGTSKHCWISFENGERSQLLWAFAGPVLAIILMTGVFLIISLGCKITFFCKELKDSSKRNDYIRAWILFLGTLLLVPLLGGACAFGLLTVNEIWDASEWLLMAFSIAVGVTFLFFTALVITTDQKGKEPASKTRDSLSGSRDAMYWSDTKPILPEASGSSYELKEKDLESSASDGEKGPMETAASTEMESHKEDP